MAKVNVKLFGVLRIDSKIAEEDLNIEKVSDIFDELNKKIVNSGENKATIETLKFKDAIVFINGERCSKKSKKLSDGDKIWLLSPASGG